MSFAKALQITLAFEGGYVDHPKDPGGATNRGVTQAVYDRWRRARGEAPRPVREIDDSEVRAIYHEYYWLPAGCGLFDWPLAAVQFDGAVNLGVSAQTKLLQAALGIPADGKLGPRTLEAVGTADHGRVARELLWLRIEHYARISGGRLNVFLRGWIMRVLALRQRTGLVDS